MIFIQTKDRKGRRLDYIQFLTACDRMAQVKYPDDGALLLPFVGWCVVAAVRGVVPPPPSLPPPFPADLQAH